MSTLQSEFNRLYAPHPLHDAHRAWLASAQGTVRAAVIELARPADWAPLGALWRGVQSDMELPAPAIAVNGRDGYQLWFSWEQAVGAEEAQAFVAALCVRYLPGVTAVRLRSWPGAAEHHSQGFPAPIPAPHPHGGQWSAFIAPDLAAVFADEPWLDRHPGDDAQAQLLARLHSMPAPAFARAWQALQPLAGVSGTPASGEGARGAVPTTAADDGRAASATHYPSDTPHAFLQAVMQDTNAPLGLRVQAAVALLAPVCGAAR